jgi:2-polyprenyl-3-methyl-5-hydroxy-6-metoxy-1,4-benzoquinol methylase
MAKDEPERSGASDLRRRIGDDFGIALSVALAYIGDRLGIFKAMADGGPLTSAQLAARTGLNERYLREWAAAMAASQYIDYRPQDQTFSLSPDQAAVLTSERSVLFAAGTFQYVVACYRQIPKLMEAFQRGGGVPFADFAPEIVEAIERMFQGGYERWVASVWIPALPEVNRKLRDGAEVAEVGCGAGQCIVPVAMAFPQSRFTGFDLDPTSIDKARRKASRGGVSDRLAFQEVAAEKIPFTDRFDLVMAFNCIHDMAHPRAALAGIRRSLKAEGVLMWSEANVSDRLEDNINPLGRSIYGASTMHCMTVSLAGGGDGLGVAVGENQARAMANEAGFSGFEKLPVENPFHQIFVLRK